MPMEEVDEFLNVIDKDNDGIVSKEEMTEVYKKAGEKMTKENMDKVYEAAYGVQKSV